IDSRISGGLIARIGGASSGRPIAVLPSASAPQFHVGGVMAQLKIPYESLDPLTIGAADDESKVYREELELEGPDANLLAAIYPEEPEPVGSVDAATREALARPVAGRTFPQLLHEKSSVAIVIDNQFRPT